jgi:cytoskeletal protein CcmA (bactofilin family)
MRPAAAPESSVVGRSTTVIGRVLGEGSLSVLGAIEGGTDIDGDLFVERDASVSGETSAGQIVVRGSLDGSTTAREAVRIEEGGLVSGELTSPRLEMAAGAQLRAVLGIDNQRAEGGARRG